MTTRAQTQATGEAGGAAIPAMTVDQLKQALASAVSGSLAFGKGVLEKYKGDISSEAQNWLEAFEDVTTMKGWGDAERFRNFNQFLDENARNWYKIYVKLNATPPADWAALRQSFLNYHLPTDRDRELRDRMINRKQGDEDVLKYITHKRLLCAEYNSNMPLEEVKRHIIDGLNPLIKQTILHKDNPTLTALQTNAIMIEKGLKEANVLSYNTIVQSCEVKELLNSIVSKIDKVVISNEENKDRISNIERKSRRDNQDQFRYDRYGRRVEDRSRERYASVSRDQSADSGFNRTLTPERRRDYDRSQYQRPYDRERSIIRYPSPYQNINNQGQRRSPSPYHSNLRKVEFDTARRLSDSRDINGNIKCYNCQRMGHFAKDCRQPRVNTNYNQNKYPNDRRVNNMQIIEDSTDSNDDMLIYQTVYVNGMKIDSLVDSGSEVSLISDILVKKLDLDIESYKGGNIRAVNGNIVKIIGQVQIKVELKFKKMTKFTNITALVIDKFAFALLLGNDFNKLAKIFIDCKNKRLFSIDYEGELVPADEGFKSEVTSNTIHLFKDTVFQPYKMHSIQVSPKNRTLNHSLKCKVKTSPDLFQKHKLYLSDAPIVFEKGRASVSAFNYNSEPTSIKCGSIIGHYYFYPQNDQEYFADQSDMDCDEETSVNLVNSMNYRKTRANQYLNEFKFNPEIYAKEAVNWRQYLDMKYPPARAYTGKLIFEKQKQNIQQAGIEFNQADWTDNLCRKCNWFYCTPDKCTLAELAENKEWCYQVDLSFREFCDFRKEFLENKDKKLERQVNIITFEPKPDNQKTIKIVERDAEIENMRFQEGTLKINSKLEKDQKRQLRYLLACFIDIFAFDDTKLGLCKSAVFKIDLIEGHHNPVVMKPIDYNESDREIIKKELERLQSLDIIEPSKSDWAFRVVLVNKKPDDNGTVKKRLTVDFRPLNKISRPVIFPLPDIQTVLSSQANKAYFSLLDDNQGYHQFLMSPEDREKTSFITQDNFMQYKRAPFGLSGMPGFYQREQTKIFRDMIPNKVIVYFDDKLISSRSFEEHITDLEEVFKRIRNSGLTLKASKCIFGQFSIEFLAHIISKNGIEPTNEKIKAISNYPVPTQLIDVKAFLGLCGYFRRFIKDFSKIAEPLSSLDKIVDRVALYDNTIRVADRGKLFRWGPEQIIAFESLKRALINAPILCHYDSNLTVEVHCDGSLKGIGGILYHVIEGKLKPFFFVSYVLKGAEVNYSACEIEVLAIVRVTTKCRKYLYGKQFTIVTDCKAIQWLHEKQSTNPRILRWSLHMQSFDYIVKHRPGVLNVVADALSRHAIPDDISDDNVERHVMVNFTIDNTDTSNIAEKQDSDFYFGAIYRSMRKDQDQSQYADNYIFNDNILLKRVKVNNERLLVVCVPNDLIFEILYNYHDHPLGGAHLGTEKTLQKIRQRYFWPTMVNDIERYVASCKDCSTKKTPTMKKPGLMLPISAKNIFEMIGLDFLGRFKPSLEGNTYIICATEYYTRFAIVAAIPAQTKEYAAQFIIDKIICIYGCPRVILTDQGVQFRSDLCQQIFDKLNITHTMTSSYRPQTNGRTEQFNHTLTKMISMYINQAQDNWDARLQFVTMAYNSSVNNTTGFSPYRLLFGREPVLPPDRSIAYVNYGLPNDIQYLRALEKSLKLMHKIVSEKTTKAGLRNKKYYDRKVRDSDFVVGQDVMVYYPTRFLKRTDKLIHKWTGPWKITRIAENGLTIDIEGSKDGKRVIFDSVHVSRIKPYYPREQLIQEIEERAINSLENRNAIESPDSDFELNYPDNLIDDPGVPTPLDHLSSDTEVYEVEEPKEEQRVLIDLDQNTDSENDQDQNNLANAGRTPPPLRRSQRIRNKPDRFVSTLTTLFLISSLGIVQGSFDKVTPVIWRISEHPLISGITRVYINVQYQSPCGLFDDEYFTISNTTELKQWCLEMFENQVEQPLSEFCQEPIDESELKLNFENTFGFEMINDQETKLKRPKRIALLAIGLGTVISIAIASIIGLSANALSEIVKTRGQYEELRRVNNQLSERVRQLQANEMRFHNILAMLQKEIDNIQGDLHHIKDSIKILKWGIPKTVTYVSTISSRLSLFKDRITDISRKWKVGKVDEKLLEIFNFTLSCGIECPLNLAKPHSCQLDKKRKMISLVFDMKITKPNVVSLESDSFTLFKRENNGTVLCPYKFQGPKNVLYDKLTDCVVSLPRNSFALKDISIIPNFDRCDAPIAANLTRKFWKAEPCEEKHSNS